MKTRNAEELMQKVRKGATAGFNVQDWLCILDAVGGWKWVTQKTKNGNAWDVTAPNGESFWLARLPGYTRVVFYGTSEREGFEPWVKKQGLMAQIDAKLGPAPVKAPRADMENTGTCPCCFGVFKLKLSKDEGIDPEMVFHGYQRPGIGYTVGKCFGVGHTPYELSREGTMAFLPLVMERRAIQVRVIEALKTAKVVLVESFNGKTYEVREADGWRFEDEKRSQLSGAEYQLKTIDRDIAFLQDKIDSWKVQPLPGSSK
jgi:hypothetical protein